MAAIRTFLAALIAISVALAPAIEKSVTSAMADSVTMADHADMPCCPCCDTQDNFKSTTCVLKCMTLGGVDFPSDSRPPSFA